MPNVEVRWSAVGRECRRHKRVRGLKGGTRRACVNRMRKGVGGEHLETRRHAALKLNLQCVVVRRTFVGYQRSTGKFRSWVVHSGGLQKPPAAGADVGHRQGLLSAECLLERHAPFERVRKPEMRVGRE